MLDFGFLSLKLWLGLDIYTEDWVRYHEDIGSLRLLARSLTI